MTGYRDLIPDKKISIQLKTLVMAASCNVSLPGMMTGQILAGVEPVEAVKYQVLIMFLLGGTTAMRVLLAVTGATWRVTDDRHRLRIDRLRKVE